MDILLSSEQGTLPAISETSSLTSLLECGIHCARQGYYVEGITLFARAREQLSPDQDHLAIVLDMLIQSHKSYLQAQQALHLASKRFVEADIEQQTQLLDLEKLLPGLKEGTVLGLSSPIEAQLPENSRRIQPAQTQHPLLLDTCLERPSPLPHSPTKDSDNLSALYFTCFGRFEVRRSGNPVALCSSRSGQMILRYLVAQPGHSATSDTLMTMLWHEDEQEVAQSRLHIAISAVRRSLKEGYNHATGYSYILCKNRTYYLNPEITISSDVEEFLQCYHAGRQANEERVAFYEQACALYKGPFLTEDTYADWSFLQRERLSRIYLAICGTLADYYLSKKIYEDATKWATAILQENRCDEAAHRQLIQIYSAQGRRSEALQQYHRCERILQEELGVQPLPETVLVVQALLANEPLPKIDIART